MKKIFFILLFSIGHEAYSFSLPSRRQDSVVSVTFKISIPAPARSTQALYNKVVDWFSNCFSNLAGEVITCSGEQISFNSKGQNNIIVPGKVHSFSVTYNLSVLIGQNQAHLIVKDFTFFRELTSRRYRKQKKGIPLLSGLNFDSLKPLRRKKAFYRIADSLVHKYGSTLKEAVK